MTTLRRFGPLFPVLVVAFLLVAPAFGAIDAVAARYVMLIGILSLLVSGLNLVLGYAGELAVGQVAFYAIGAYVAGYVGTTLGAHDLLVGLAAVIAVAVVVGLVTGVPSLRLAGWPLAMVTFFLVMIVPSLIEVLQTWTGGSRGMPVDRATVLGAELGAYGFYIVVVVVVAAWFLVARNTILSPHGTGFLVLRQSPELAAAVGLSVYRTKLKVYVLGTVAPALGGALFAWLDGFVAPDTFAFGLAITVLSASVLGGGTSVYGALLGAAVMELTRDTLAGLNEYQLIVYGVFLVVAAIALPEGVVGLAKKWLRRAVPSLAAPLPLAPHAGDDARGTWSIDGKTVTVSDLDKSFGGNHAVDGVSFTARPGHITALIGTNGSGKTTVLNMINGYLAPDSGSVTLGDGQDSRPLTGSPADSAARAGVARTFQTPIMPAGITALDLVALGAYQKDPADLATTVLRLPGHWRRVRRSHATATRLLHDLRLTDVAHREVDSLPLGTRRLVEVARSLAADPSVLLLDEVGSGLDEGDLDRLENLLREIRQAGATIILVEHNFPLVMRLADHVHVLSRGRTLVEGDPATVRNDERVTREYLGTGVAAGPRSEKADTR